jgi:DNA-binding SARP family transcriptional activator/DNA-binding beta-propeller fold protein YncE
MDFRILGGLEVEEEGRSLRLGGHQERVLLALLLLRANEVVPVDEIVDDLWGADAPPSATRSVHALISKLRRRLENGSAGNGESRETGVLQTRPHGYVLTVGSGELDVHRFESLVEDGRGALAAGRAADASDAFRKALALWRGAPLAEFAYDSFAQLDIARLEELRLSAHEERIEADLALGHHGDLVPELEVLAAENRVRERLSGQLMLALYRSGRQAEALQAYQQTRQALADELGIEPGPALRRLEQGILRQDESLSLSEDEPPRRRAATPSPAHRQLRRSGIAVAVAAAAAAAAAIAVGTTRSSEGSVEVRPNSLAVIDPGSNRVIADLDVGRGPSALAVDNGAVWVGNLDDRTVNEVNAQSRRITRTISLEGLPSALTAGAGATWILSGDLVSTLTRIRRGGATQTTFPVPSLVRPYPTENSPTPGCLNAAIANSVGVLAAATFGGGRAWFVCGGDPPMVGWIDPATNRLGGVPYPDSERATAIAWASHFLWLANRDENTVSQFDPVTRETLVHINVAAHPVAIAIGAGSVWVAGFSSDAISRIAGRQAGLTPVVTTIRVGDGPVALAFDRGTLWVANAGDHTISRIDTTKGTVTATIELGNVVPTAIAAGAGKVWVTAGPP